MKWVCAGAVMLGLMASVALAGDVIIRPVDATASSTLVTWATFSPQNAISNVGWDASLDQVVYTLDTDDPIPAPWPTFGPDMQRSWYSDNETFGTGKWIAFDLGDTFVVRKLHIWPQGPKGIKDIVVQYLVNGSWVDAQSMTIDYAEPRWDFQGYDYALASPIAARHVRLLITSNWVADPTAEDARMVMIGKIRFEGVVPPPPGTDMIIRPADATASSTLVLSWAAFPPQNTISNVGWDASLDQVVYTLDTYDPIPVPWPTFGPDMQRSWYSDNETFDAGKWIAFDLGDTFRVTGFHIWPQGPNGIKDIVVQYLVNGNWVDAQGLTIPYAEPSWTFEGYDCALARPITVRQVRLLITSNWVADPTAEIARMVMIGKIRFEGKAPVPVTVQGTAVLNGFVGDNTTVGLKFQLTPVAGGETLTRQVFLQPDGSFSFLVSPNTYNITVKGDSWLSARLNNVAVVSDPQPVGSITLTGSDGNGDNQVSFEDFSMLQNAYGQHGVSAANPLAAAATGGCGLPGLLLAVSLGLTLRSLSLRERD